MHPLGGFATTQQSSGMHELQITRDDAGITRFHARQSSQSSGWLPEGTGYRMFKPTLPTEWPEPPPAPIKPDDGWQATSVRVNVRRWLAALGLWPSDFVHATGRPSVGESLVCFAPT